MDLHPDPDDRRCHRAGGLPLDNPNPPIHGPPAPGTEGVFATFDSTGRLAGIAMVCPFFTVPSWQQQEAKCCDHAPGRRDSSMPTPDVASVTDPAGVVGSLEARADPGR